MHELNIFAGTICAYITKHAVFQHTNIVLSKNCLTNNGQSCIIYVNKFVFFCTNLCFA